MAASGGENPGDPRENDAKWGYDMYPERRGRKHKSTLFEQAWFGKGLARGSIDKFKCENHVFQCFQTSPIVKLMTSALKSAGCEVDLRRHVSCEVCDESVTGGYDPELNQVVVCQNMAKKAGIVQAVLTHELIHMFDLCRAKLDFANLRHLACTEVRAANLAHCSFASAWAQGYASIFKIANTHSDCVKAKAIASVMVARNVSRDVATEVVDQVFVKCYADLEPIGRRIRRGSYDMHKAYQERTNHGYCD